MIHFIRLSILPCIMHYIFALQCRALIKCVDLHLGNYCGQMLHPLTYLQSVHWKVDWLWSSVGNYVLITVPNVQQLVLEQNNSETLLYRNNTCIHWISSTLVNTGGVPIRKFCQYLLGLCITAVVCEWDMVSHVLPAVDSMCDKIDVILWPWMCSSIIMQNDLAKQNPTPWKRETRCGWEPSCDCAVPQYKYW